MPEKTHVLIPTTFRPGCIIPKDSKAMGSEREEYAMLRGKKSLTMRYDAPIYPKPGFTTWYCNSCS
jgi:hypothetical protein